jgi:hypothetical protein
MKQSIIEGIRRYVDHHCPTGEFLRAVLSNKLKEAIFSADDDNILVLPEIVRYCYNEIPGLCWGSPEKVRAWIADRPVLTPAQVEAGEWMGV